jgi:hypothetical protein
VISATVVLYPTYITKKAKMLNISTSIKVVVSFVVVAALVLVATRFSSWSNVSDEWIVMSERSGDLVI